MIPGDCTSQRNGMVINVECESNDLKRQSLRDTEHTNYTSGLIKSSWLHHKNSDKNSGGYMMRLAYRPADCLRD